MNKELNQNLSMDITHDKFDEIETQQKVKNNFFFLNFKTHLISYFLTTIQLITYSFIFVKLGNQPK